MMTACDMWKQAKVTAKPEPLVEELPLYKKCEYALEEYRSGTNVLWAHIQGVDTQMWTAVWVDAKDEHEHKRNIQRIRNTLGKNGYYTDVFSDKFGIYLMICWDLKVIAIAAGLTFDPLTGELEKPCYGCPSEGGCNDTCNKWEIFRALEDESEA